MSIKYFVNLVVVSQCLGMCLSNCSDDNRTSKF